MRLSRKLNLNNFFMRLFIVTGQTATGKTDYALQLAKEHNGELINCDSRQIYKHLDIITGKDIEKGSEFQEVTKIDSFSIGYYVLEDIPIWLYDIVDPKEYFSSFDYQTCAIEVIKDVLARSKTPIIVGGTYFYIKHLLYDIETEHIQPNWELRTSLATKTVEELQHILKVKDEYFFNQLNNSDRNNPQRLIRKIEIVESGADHKTESDNKPLTEKLSRLLGIVDLEITYMGIQKEKKEVISNIEERVEKRYEHKAVEEVKKLLTNGYSKEDPGLQTIGYQQLIKYLENKTSLEQAKEEWTTKEIQYAKRQLTFMKKDNNIRWL